MREKERERERERERDAEREGEREREGVEREMEIYKHIIIYVYTGTEKVYVKQTVCIRCARNFACLLIRELELLPPANCSSKIECSRGLPLLRSVVPYAIALWDRALDPGRERAQERVKKVGNDMNFENQSLCVDFDSIRDF